MKPCDSGRPDKKGGAAEDHPGLLTVLPVGPKLWR